MIFDINMKTFLIQTFLFWGSFVSYIQGQSVTTPYSGQQCSQANLDGQTGFQVVGTTITGITEMHDYGFFGAWRTISSCDSGATNFEILCDRDTETSIVTIGEGLSCPVPCSNGASDTNPAVTAQCDCGGDTAEIGDFCLAGSVFQACTPNTVLNEADVECACGSSDDSTGTISSYVAGHTCIQGIDEITAGSFVAPQAPLETCSDMTCDAGWSPDSAAATLHCAAATCDNTGNDNALCCNENAACSTITCATGWTADSTAATLHCAAATCDNTGDDNALCCDENAACSSFTCAAGWSADSTAASTKCAGLTCTGDDNALCCNEDAAAAPQVTYDEVIVDEIGQTQEGWCANQVSNGKQVYQGNLATVATHAGSQKDVAACASACVLLNAEQYPLGTNTALNPERYNTVTGTYQCNVIEFGGTTCNFRYASDQSAMYIQLASTTTKCYTVNSGSGGGTAPVCIRPDVPVHVLRGVSVETVKVGRLNVGDVVIGEGKTSAVKRVEHFSVDDEACVVPKDLCGGFDDNVVVSKSHAVRCQTWPTNTWTFCQPDWQRVTTTEYVHVELESYLDDHLLSGSIVLESWDGYTRETDSIEDACSTRGCPWPHKWSSVDDNRWTRVDLRSVLHDASPRLRQIRPL